MQCDFFVLYHPIVCQLLFVAICFTCLIKKIHVIHQNLECLGFYSVYADIEMTNNFYQKG